MVRKKITGFKQKEDGSLDRANEPNSFFNRFSSEPSSVSSSPAPSQTDLPPFLDPQLACHISAVSSSTSVMGLAAGMLLSPTTSEDTGALSTSPYHLSVSCSHVKGQLERLSRNKAAHLDDASPRVLKACADQLCGILQHLFNISLSQEKVPMLRKTFCLVPVQKASANPVWTKQAALWGSCSLISPVHLRPYSLLYYERKST